MTYVQAVNERRLGFLYKLHAEGLTLEKDYIIMLKEGGYISDDSIPVKKQLKRSRAKYTRDYSVKTKEEQKADEYVDIVKSEENTNIEVIDHSEYKKEENLYTGTREISIKDWKVGGEDMFNHNNEFVKWVDSMNTSFKLRVNYQPFNLYKQQAMQWLSENKTLSDYKTYEGQLNFAREEKRRCFETRN